MARDSSRAVRRAILATLKAEADVTALVPAVDIHPQSPPSNPRWPFIRAGAPTFVPVRAACLDGGSVTLAMHGFAKARLDGAGAVQESAEDHAHRIGETMSAALDGRGLVLDTPYPATATIRCNSVQTLQDRAERDAYHSIVSLVVTVDS